MFSGLDQPHIQTPVGGFHKFTSSELQSIDITQTEEQKNSDAYLTIPLLPLHNYSPLSPGPCYTDTRGALCTGALEGVVCTKQLCCATVGAAWGHPCERCADLDCPQGHLRNLATKECQVG